MSPASSLRLAVFDCDGTIVDSQHAIAGAVAAAWAAAGLPSPEAAQVRRVIGLPLVEALAALLPKGEAAAAPGLAETYRTAFRALSADAEAATPLFPGVEAALAALDEAGVLLGIATGKSRHGLLATLARHGLEGRFVTLQTADRGPGKPHPDMLLHAMAETGAEPAATVMIGDTTFDIIMAREARVPSVGVSWGYHDAAELASAGADEILHAFDDVPAAVARLTSGAP